ncbi:hypothetical protein [Streptomyces sp. SP18CS02]|uniref:hypothetical protein n=1 Tax=Streptomyces sp. SP18CS02 TaxID=3002531 RepID=UPI002E769A40|nr:hypothetical protein [Streptomyces sp. SP18CS02]MEE1757420.1 hypothetical protein [Streptomyces sp. SP18CS02]
MGIPITSAAPFDPGTDFRPTHVVPRDGLPSWELPDPSRPTEPLDPFLPVQLVERVGDWGRVVCSNGWSAWVDGRLLISVPHDPPVAGQPVGRTADPRPLLARAEESVTRYRRVAEEMAAGTLDGEGFLRRTRGLRVGIVVDGEAMWLYDAEQERWVYCDGTRLGPFAASSDVPAAVSGSRRSASPPPVPAAAASGPPGVAGYETDRITGAEGPDAPPEGARVAERDDGGPRYYSTDG